VDHENDPGHHAFLHNNRYLLTIILEPCEAAIYRRNHLIVVQFETLDTSLNSIQRVFNLRNIIVIHYTTLETIDSRPI
jgi:hypothetical protein